MSHSRGESGGYMCCWGESEDQRLVAFRWLVVAAQAATIVITWRLWTVRVDPPLLPAVDSPQFSPAIWLLGTLALTLALPGLGVALHFGLLVVAMLLDQTRMQPEVISLGLLLVGTLSSSTSLQNSSTVPRKDARLIGRMHLIALWFFAGFHKLLSPDYYTGVVPWMSGSSSPNHLITLQVIGGLMALAEMSLGVMAVVPRLRRACAIAACVFHLLVTAWLAGRHWNPAVWPWNVALAAAGPALIWPWRTSLVHDLRAAQWPARVAATALLVTPVGYYFGLIDPYLAHCLYARNVPKAQLLTTGGQQEIDTWSALRVPLPPAHRIFEQYFQATALPSERLVIDDPRWSARRRGWGWREIRAKRDDAE